jgi:hypothetical protein
MWHNKWQRSKTTHFRRNYCLHTDVTWSDKNLDLELSHQLSWRPLNYSWSIRHVLDDLVILIVSFFLQDMHIIDKSTEWVLVKMSTTPTTSMVIENIEGCSSALWGQLYENIRASTIVNLAADYIYVAMSLEASVVIELAIMWTITVRFILLLLPPSQF